MNLHTLLHGGLQRPSTGPARSRGIGARRRIITLAAIVTIVCLSGLSGVTHAGTITVKPRTIVTTDMEQDDFDSLVRYLLYTNEVDTQGIVYSASRFHWSGDGLGTLYFHSGREYSTPQTSWRWTGNTTIEDVMIPAYAAAYPNLRVHDPRYPTPAYLLSIIRLGNVEFEGEMVKDTPGSNLIKEKMLDSDPRPLWVQVWGGGNTAARALKAIEDQYKNTPDWAAIYQKVSAKTIISFNSTGQDDTYANYIRPNWPNIQVYNAGSGAWGYKTSATAVSPQPADQDYFGSAWTKANVVDVGPLGAIYFTWGDGRQMAGDQLDVFGLVPYPCGYFIRCPGRPQWSFISEGDNPAFMNLFASGLASWQNPTWGGYGGRLSQNATTPSLWSANTRENNELGAPLTSRTLTVAAATGETFLKVSSTSGFSAGDPIMIDSGEALEWSTVQAVSSSTLTLTLAAPLTKAHAVGATVNGYGSSGFASNRYVTVQQHDFANRLRWTVTPNYADANHAPRVTVIGPRVTPGDRRQDREDISLSRSAAPGELVALRGVVTDPDGDAVTYKWWEYKEVDTYTGAVVFSSTDSEDTTFVVPADVKPGQTIHVILEVTDDGAPTLTRYARVVVTVAAGRRQ